MKHILHKVIWMMTSLFCVTSIWAQDVIVTTDAKKIDAKILEVSKTEIKYKELDNLDGPIYVLSTDEISSVIYSNGKVVLYNESPKETVNKNTIDDNTADILLQSGQTITAQIIELRKTHIAYILNGISYTLPASQVQKVTFVQTGQVTDYTTKNVSEVILSSAPKKEDISITPKYVSRSGNTYYYDGRKMRGYSYERFLANKCTPAYKQYKSGKRVSTAGWVLFGLGVGLDVGFSWWAPYTWIPALGLEVASIPTLIVGYVRMHKSANTFNTSCAKQPEAYWSINVSQDGLGVAFNF